MATNPENRSPKMTKPSPTVYQRRAANLAARLADRLAAKAHADAANPISDWTTDNQHLAHQLIQLAEQAGMDTSLEERTLENLNAYAYGDR